MLNQKISNALPDVTSLPESEDGTVPCNSLNGQKTNPYGPDHVHASHSQSLESRKGETMSVTSGLSGSNLLPNSDLRLSSENKSPQPLTMGGSTKFVMTSVEKITPSGRKYVQRRVSGPLIEEIGCGLWPTPRAVDGEKNSRTREGALKEAKRGKLSDLPGTAILALWPTPTVRDYKDNGDLSKSQVRKDGKERNDTLGRVAYGSTAQTENRGSLNPAFPCWLMGYPTEWESCADLVTLSSRIVALHLSERS